MTLFLLGICIGAMTAFVIAGMDEHNRDRKERKYENHKY